MTFFYSFCDCVNACGCIFVVIGNAGNVDCGGKAVDSASKKNGGHVAGKGKCQLFVGIILYNLPLLVLMLY